VRFGEWNNGGKGYAQYTTAPVAHLGRKPASIDHLAAAGVPMAGLTAYQRLFDHVQLGWDQTVLVNGAAGGVGHFAVQLAKTRNAHVIGVASGRHQAFLRELGVDEYIDYTTTGVAELARDVDLVVDTVGGPHGHRLLRVLKPGGVLAPIFFGEYHPERAAELGISFVSAQVHSDGPQLTELGRLIEAGQLRVGIDSIFPLAEAAKAHERAEQGHIQGKIVLQVVED
jgi:NADPH:quinone reductase-like Zn-dependent oxidoreductase